MFFTINKTADARFPFSDPIGQWMFNHDNGWQRTGNGWIKGYRHDNIGHGNFCEIKCENDIVSLHHDIDRSFPLWWDKKTKSLSNFSVKGTRLWTDRVVRLTSTDLQIDCIDIIGSIDLSPLSFIEAVRLIKLNLLAKFDQLAAEPASKKLFVSGGIDTLTLYSWVKDLSIEVEVLDHEYFQYDYFSNFFLSKIKQDFWAYNQIHHWREHSWLITGACGDEFMFRGPTTIAMWTAWHNINFLEMLEKKQGYHRQYFLLDKNKKIFQSWFEQRKHLQKKLPTEKDLAAHLIDCNLNDHQHWHFGNTITWTPFKDIALFRLMLRLNTDVLLEHFIDASVSRALILPEHLSLLSRDKNIQSREHLLPIQS